MSERSWIEQVPAEHLLDIHVDLDHQAHVPIATEICLDVLNDMLASSACDDIIQHLFPTSITGVT